MLSTDTILYGKWEKIATPPSSGGGGSHVTKYYILHYESMAAQNTRMKNIKKIQLLFLIRFPKELDIPLRVGMQIKS